MRILVIEDERLIANAIKKGLENNNFAVDVAFDGEEGLSLVRDNEYDLVILDLMLPIISGEDICKILRKEGNNTYVLMLTAKDSLINKINGLSIGADDYLTKPFEFDELVARAKAILRRKGPIKGNILKISDIILDLDRYIVKRGGKELKLTRTEFMLLEYFIRNKNIVLTRNQILEHVWDMNVDMFTNVVDAHIKNLRKKLGWSKEDSLIKTLYGVGYKLIEKNNN